MLTFENTIEEEEFQAADDAREEHDAEWDADMDRALAGGKYVAEGLGQGLTHALCTLLVSANRGHWAAFCDRVEAEEELAEVKELALDLLDHVQED
jgi:hypothetical protein